MPGKMQRTTIHGENYKHEVLAAKCARDAFRSTEKRNQVDYYAETFIRVLSMTGVPLGIGIVAFDKARWMLCREAIKQIEE